MRIVYIQTVRWWNIVQNAKKGECTLIPTLTFFTLSYCPGK
nr:MAG TPA: Nuclear polyadenylated RNA-binding 2 protein CCCH zinc finger 1 [Caudoviricetes sp.]